MGCKGRHFFSSIFKFSTHLSNLNNISFGGRLSNFEYLGVMPEWLIEEHMSAVRGGREYWFLQLKNKTRSALVSAAKFWGQLKTNNFKIRYCWILGRSCKSGMQFSVMQFTLMQFSVILWQLLNTKAAKEAFSINSFLSVSFKCAKLLPPKRLAKSQVLGGRLQFCYQVKV